METTKAKDYQSAHAQFRIYLRKHGMRHTPERDAILKQALAMPPHFTALALHGALEREGYHVSVATVYNTMDQLCQAGLMRKLNFGAREAAYERNASSHHLHLVCTDCGKIKEARDDNATQLILARKYQSFTPAWCSATIYGVCSACARRRKRLLSKDQSPRTTKTKDKK